MARKRSTAGQIVAAHPAGDRGMIVAQAFPPFRVSCVEPSIPCGREGGASIYLGLLS